MGAPSQRTQRTQVIPGTCNPRWNSSMQFFVRNANEDVLCLTVFDKDYFSPNGKLGDNMFIYYEVYPYNKAGVNL